MVTIEHASAGEVDEVATLFEAYRAFYHCVPDAPAARHFISQRLANRDSAILLAKDGGRAIGFVQLYPVFSSLKMKRAWILNDLFVHPDYRGGGVARALMEAARRLGGETRAASLSLETAHGNAHALPHYPSSYS